MQKNLIQYLGLIIIALILALIDPGIGQAVFPYGKVWLFSLFLLSVLKVKTTEIIKLEDKRMALGFITLMRLILVPIVVYVGSGMLVPDYQLPLTLLALAPVGETAALFTEILGGVISFTVALATLTGIAAPIWIPLFFEIFMGQKLNLPLGNLMKDLLLVLMLPLMIGIVLQIKLKAVTRQILKIHKPLSLLFLLLILVGSFASQIDRLLHLDAETFLISAGVIICFFILLGVLGLAVSLYLPREYRIATIVSFLLMNYTLAIYISAQYFQAQPVVLLTVVLAIVPWNLSYLVFGTIMDYSRQIFVKRRHIKRKI